MKDTDRKAKKRLKTVELFAGVGGFRLGLCGTKNRPLDGYDVIWANQWEPATKGQHAAWVYKDKFHYGKEPNPYFNEDINRVVDLDKLPVPKHDLLVGGFPCQDYSVARTLSQASGIIGKKGVLWWAIHKILQRHGKNSPRYLMLENVDRLLKSPAKQRGRDFGIILASLNDLGYSVEWRIINAADYGMPQRRRRIFIMGYKNTTRIHKELAKAAKNKSLFDWLRNSSIISRAFPLEFGQLNNLSPAGNEIIGDLVTLTNEFRYPFQNTGVMINRKIFTIQTKPHYSGKQSTLKDIVIPLKQVSKEFFVHKKNLKNWKYLKGAKKEQRGTKNGFPYFYTEGPVAFPDPLDRPSRTIVTGEGGPSPSRFKHVIKQNGLYRRLTPLELERLCMFPDNHTAHSLVGDNKRAFFMGNALVVGVIERLGRALLEAHNES